MGPDFPPDPAPGLNVNPAPDPPLSLNQAEAGWCPGLRGNSRVKVGFLLYSQALLSCLGLR